MRPVRPFQKFERHTDYVNGVLHLPGGKQVMTCSSDGSLRAWHSRSGEQKQSWQNGKDKVNAMALSPDMKTVVTGNSVGMMMLWTIATGLQIIASWQAHTQGVESVCWSPDAKRVVSGSLDGTAKVWDVENQKIVLEIKTKFSVAWAAIYSPDMTMIATGGVNKENENIKIWDANTGKLLRNLKGHTGTVYCLAWAADGGTLASGSYDKSIRIWNTTTWQQITVLKGHTNLVRDIAMSPDGCILASASGDCTARLWNLESSQLIQVGLPLPHAKPVSCVSFSEDTKHLATSCWDKNAYYWDISATVRDTAPQKLRFNPQEPLLNVDATQHSTKPNASRLQSGFFEHSQSSTGRPVSPSSTTTTASSTHHNLLTRPRLDRLRRILLRRRKDESAGLQAHRPMSWSVPFARDKPRNHLAGHVKNTKNIKNLRNASAGSSRSPQSNIAQQSGNSSVSTTSTTSSTPSHPGPRAIIRQPGRWSHLWLSVGCISAEFTDG